MPDRSGEDRPGRDTPDALPDDLWAAEQRARLERANAARAQAEADMHAQTAALKAQAAQAALDACTNCDPHGIDPHGLPCPHYDGRPAAKRGMAALRAQMGWNDESHADTPQNPPTGQPEPQNHPQKLPPHP